ncbi:endospore germination permease [Oscillospiraceae bacterium MB08-C2-2]|nr:endospore germination permease [Oscillospiraceae bacterium MB08-C2-2]
MDRFTPKHFIFLMMATGIVSLKTYPIVFIGGAGRDSWVAVIISSILIFLYFLFAAKTMNLVPENNFLDVYQKAVGKKAAVFLLAIFFLTVLMTLVESAAIEADSMHQSILLETPEWYFILFFAIPAIYVVCKDLVAIMIITIIGISFIMVAGIHLGMLTTQQKTFQDLFPVFYDGLTVDFILSIFKSLGLYGFLTITLPYMQYISTKRISLTKYVIIGLIFIIQMQIVSITGIFMTFSPETASSYYYPKLIQTHLVSYFEILEFGELYVMLQILCGWFLKYLISYNCILILIKFFNIKKKMLHILTYAISIVVLVLSYFVTKNSIRLFNLLEYVPWISLVNFIVIPTIVFTLYRIRLKNHPQPQAQA